MTSWSLDQKSRGREFWEIALGYGNYDFEYRLAMVRALLFIYIFKKKLMLLRELI